MRYRAFISYSHVDAAWAAWLHRKLEGYRLPRRMRGRAGQVLPERLSPIFRDREELASAGELGPQIQAALADSEALIVLCSPAAARSRWVDAEILNFKRAGHAARVYALIVDGEPNSGDERECFPPSLRFELEADGTLGTRPSEPLAADVRPGKDGKSLALSKLVSGLLGVNLDSLRQREAKRRHQRMALVTALALVVMLVTSFLAVQAVLARKAAERRQKQAEALVDFMLGDLNDKLSQVSRLDILEGVQDHAMEYFQSLPVTDLTAASLAQRSLALTQIGNVRRDQGHLDKALASYRAAEKLAARLAREAPADASRQLAYAEVLAYIGTCYWYQGDLDGAQAGFDAAQAVLLRAQALAPGDARLQFQLSTIDNNAGHVLEGRGRIDEAMVHYRRMLELSRRLVARDPSNLDWQNQLGLAHNNLAKMALLRGDVAGAITEYEADVAIEAALAARDPRNNSQAERLLISRGALGRTLALAGRLEDGAAMLRLALDDAHRLNGQDGESVAFSEDVAIYAWQLARLQRLRGDAAGARALVEQSLAESAALIKQDASQPGWQRDRAEALVERAQQLIDAGEESAARADLQSALAILEPQLAAQPDDRGALLATTAARLGMATLMPAAEAGPALRKALAAVDAQGSGQRDPRLLALRAALASRLGQHVGATPMRSPH
ncbi:MAG: toll/interleukin-1 receptor domain-containing protein [Arenimonas sp.]